MLRYAVVERPRPSVKPKETSTIKKKLATVATGALMSAELTGMAPIGLDQPTSQQERIYPPSILAASYHPELPQPGYFDVFKLDETPVTPTEFIAESQADKWQPQWGVNARAMIAYPWARNPQFNGGTWEGSYWIDNNSNPPHSWINNIMPIFKVNSDGSITPAEQLYSADDPEYPAWVMKMAKHMNIPIVLLSNWGINSKSDQAGQKMYEFANSDQNDNDLVRLAPLIEADGEKNPKAWKLVKLVNHILSYAKDNPHAWRDPETGRFMVSAYSVDEDWPEMVRRWKIVEERTGVLVLLRPYGHKPIKDFIAGFKGPETFGAFPYRPAEPVETIRQNGRVWKQISAKFEKFGGPQKLPEDPDRFIRDVLEDVKNPAALTTFIFDEIGEGSALAPGLRVLFTPQGIYIDWSNSYGYLYANILHRLLPPLPEVISDFDMAFGRSKPRSKPRIIFPGNTASKDSVDSLVMADGRLAAVTLPAVGEIFPGK